MPPCGRLMMDVTTGHPPYPPINFTIPKVSKVFVNNMLILTVGAQHPPHGCQSPTNPTVPLISGSATVFAENNPVGRLLDVCGCGEVLSSGSGNVIVN